MQNIKKVLQKYEEINNQSLKYILNNYIFFAKENDLLEFLDKVLEYNPSISLLDLDDIFFKNKKYIEHYGIDFLAKNIDKITPSELQYGINDENLKERIMLINNLGLTLNTINKELIFSEDIDDDFFVQCKDILSDYQINKFINETFIFDKEDVNYILHISNNKEEKEYLEFFIYNFLNISKSEYKMLIRHEKKYLNKLIKLFNNQNTNLDMDFKEFIDFYDYNEELIKDVKINSKTKDNFRIYLNSNIKVTNNEELNNIQILNYNYNRKLIENETNINKIKNIITNTYFCVSYKEFLDISLDIIKFANSILTLKEQKIINDLINETSKYKLINMYDKLNDIKNIYNLFINIENKYKEYCKNDIINGLYTPNTCDNIVYFNGQPFNFLVHKIKGHGFINMANKLSNDPSLWNTNYVENSYISTSLISDLFLGVDSGIGTILGFNNITSNDILDMGPTDIDTSINSIKSKRKNNKCRFLPTKNLIEETNMKYNEIVLNRYRNQKAVLPDFILCFDTISISSKRIADYFNVPIFLINTKSYINKMNIHLEQLLSLHEFQKYYNYRNKKYYSILDNYELVSKEFREEILYNEFLSIINKMREDLKSNYNKEKEIQYMRLLERLNNKNKSIIARNNYYNSKIYKFDNKDITNYLKLTKEN